jgi:hypothetical protein
LVRVVQRRTVYAPALIAVAVALAVWLVPLAIANITNRRYADGVAVGTRAVLVVVAVVIGGAALDRARQRRWWLGAAAALGGLVGLTAVVLLVWLAPPALYKNIPAGKDRAGAEAVTRTGFIAGLAGLAALGGLAITARTYRLTEQGQITDRYTKAIEQLGGDKLDVRLGGIYALERIAHDSKRDQPTVVEVLGAFVRERTNPARTEKPTVADVLNDFLTLVDDRPEKKPTPSEAGARVKPPVDIQAALTVLGRLRRRPGVSRGDLTGAHLNRAQLGGADLTGATLGGAHLTRAFLGGAHLTLAWLKGADLTLAWLKGADLTLAWLKGADLTGAWLGGVDLTDALGLTQEQLDSAFGNARTKLPDRYERPTAWPTSTQ